MIEHAAEPAAVHSRSVLAGYDPERLFTARVLIVGLGALGQNLALNLALTGIGQIALVDFDEFESHNATRSPFFPDNEERAAVGLSKVRVVAHRLPAMMTAPTAKVHLFEGRIQEVGDLAIRWADVVFSAVDNGPARAYLAERSRLNAKPMIEAGFHGNRINLGVFGTEEADPCFRCLDPAGTGVFSCDLYAQAAAQQRIVPAIQTSAALAAALVAEQGVAWLHGEATLVSKRAYFDVRSADARTTSLTQDSDCPGVHRPTTVEHVITAGTLRGLIAEADRLLGPSELGLAETVVVRSFCTICGEIASIRQRASVWMESPMCDCCGGRFPRLGERGVPARFDWLDTASAMDASTASMTLEDAGIPAGCVLRAFPAGESETGLQRVGSFENMFETYPQNGEQSP